MERFYFEIPSIERKEDALDYVKEHRDYNSKINGSGSLDRFGDDYEGWLEKLERDYNTVPSEERVPARTYFLVRENDNKIVGMTNIRLSLTDSLRKHGGHIGYGIRPTERRKGYNKINLYLGLKVCEEYGIDEALLFADIDNPASWKTMEALGGKRINEGYNDLTKSVVVVYTINVKESLNKYKDTYEPLILSTKGKTK